MCIRDSLFEEGETDDKPRGRRAARMRRCAWNCEMKIAFSYPPLEGEGRLALSAAKCETGWGDSLATHAPFDMRDRHPTPPLLSVASTLPLQGRVSGIAAHSGFKISNIAPIHVRILATRCARGLHQLHPSQERRAQGKPGADCTRGRAHRVHE